MWIDEMKGYFRMMSNIPVQAELAEVYPESYEVFMQCFFHVSKFIISTPEQTIFNNMATFKYSSEDNGKSSESKMKSSMARIRKKLEMMYFPRPGTTTTTKTRGHWSERIFE